MSKKISEIKPIVMPFKNNKNDNAFYGDTLDRKKTAELLTNYLDRLKEGAVLAIDAPWGEGKTWFGRNWAKYLNEKGNKHKVVYIDAFAQDYIEDPFVLITAEIINAIKDDDNNKSQLIQEKAKDVMKAMLPVATKIVLNSISRFALGSIISKNEMQEILNDVRNEAINATSKIIEKKLDDYSKEKQSLEIFITTLTDVCANEEKPVVVFIDELDRCRPTFAVQLIERIKHLFDVPNLVFVLLLNREQLEHSIKGVYGQGTDAATYLGKFINIFFRLPKIYYRYEDSSKHPATKFIINVLKRYGYQTRDYPITRITDEIADNFTKNLSEWVIVKNLSLRDIEQACALFIMSNIKENRTAILTYLIVLKLKEKALYEGLLRDESSAHKKAKDKLSELYVVARLEENKWPDLYFIMLEEYHLLHLQGANSLQSYQYLKRNRQLFFGSNNYPTKIGYYLNMIDLPIDLS